MISLGGQNLSRFNPAMDISRFQDERTLCCCVAVATREDVHILQHALQHARTPTYLSKAVPESTKKPTSYACFQRKHFQEKHKITLI